MGWSEHRWGGNGARVRCPVQLLCQVTARVLLRAEPAHSRWVGRKIRFGKMVTAVFNMLVNFAEFHKSLGCTKGIWGAQWRSSMACCGPSLYSGLPAKGDLLSKHGSVWSRAKQNIALGISSSLKKQRPKLWGILTVMIFTPSGGSDLKLCREMCKIPSVRIQGPFFSKWIKQVFCPCSHLHFFATEFGSFGSLLPT